MKNKVFKLLSFVLLVLMPTIVFAEDGDFFVALFGSVFTEAFLTIFMSIFVLNPLSQVLKVDPTEQKKMFWKLFWIRIIILLILDCIIPEVAVMMDTFGLFIGAFIVIPMSVIVQTKRSKVGFNASSTPVVNLVCPGCKKTMTAGDAFCTNCGAKAPAEVTNATPTTVLDLPSASDGQSLYASRIFGYNLTEDQMVEQIIKNEVSKAGEAANATLGVVEKKKNMFTFIYAIILLICVSLFFFHSYTTLLIIVTLIVTIIYICSVRNYNIYKYLKKEVKARPDEKIGYIVSTILSGQVNAVSGRIIRIIALLIAFIIPLIIFRTPHTIYEKQDDGYVIRFYTIGWLENEKELVIPEEYKGEPVVGIRGDVFAYVHSLEKVVLPDTIKEIRGGAFAYASRLEEINIPDGIPEIKGETFQGCRSLKEITIPDSVKRIGGHAFRENSSLAKVNISPKSKLKEIGSSAFRNCTSLKEIYLPRNVSINERAFKESPTHVKEYTSDGIVLEEEYKYQYYAYIQLDEELVIPKKNSYDKDDSTIKLLKVEGEYGDYQFNLSLVFEGKSYTFALFREQSYLILSDNLAVDISDDYVFDYYDDRVSLTVYYN